MAVTDEFTPREREIMALAWGCMETEPKVDYKKLASLANMTNPVSASNAWAKIKKKMQAQTGNAGAATTSTATATAGDAVATPKSKKRANKSTPAEEGGESPTKKARKPKVKKEVIEEDVEGGEEETML